MPNNGDPSARTKGYDPTDSIGNHTKSQKGHIIHFIHVPTNDACHFKAFLTSWVDQFKQDWKETTTMGRMDPIRTYSRTSRQINFSIEIPSFSLEEAAYNLREIEKLIQMSYPTFETLNLANASNTSQNNSTSTGNATDAKRQAAVDNITSEKSKQDKLIYKSISTMVSPPLFRIKFNNWLNDTSIDKNLTNNSATQSGLYGTIENVKFEPNLTEGGFYSSNDLYDNRQGKENILIPKLLKLEITFIVLHTNELGYNNFTNSPRSSGYPYGASNLLNKVKNKKIKVK